MKEHHQAAINNLISYLRDKEEFLAIILAGSIAKGTAKDSSDIDVYLVVKDEEFVIRLKENNLFFFNDEICGYSGGYIDGKIINIDFLKQAVNRGSEPTRASFIGSTVVFSRISGFEEIIAQIPIYPEKNRTKNLTDFYAQVLLYGKYFAIQALEQGNNYLLNHSISNLVLFASRMILAHNRILFPCHKSLMKFVEKAADKPANYIQMANEMMINPTKEKVLEFVEVISSFQEWGLTFGQAVSIFVENNEWNWINQDPPLQDR
ncbi:nucleotidyltransferase domain-containing protein [Cohnella silvisoli]|uniref:Nucleotidyltransferase domain-containing protein n=1 Tax=Cohnella silvisoli TaxID=2873699 RepID=A0ABV1KUY1_9BACL|nr:nucleotidyltransferase domain-containing protein [Cohnella silvisoli]MCD9021529.1 nucleotidyltransferase domain-containing protein [Cohnella silvisoli]